MQLNMPSRDVDTESNANHPESDPPLVQGNAAVNYICRHLDVDNPAAVPRTFNFVFDKVGRYSNNSQLDKRNQAHHSLPPPFGSNGKYICSMARSICFNQ